MEVVAQPAPPLGEPTRHWRTLKHDDAKQIRRIGYAHNRITCIACHVGPSHWTLTQLDGSLSRIHKEPQVFPSERALKDYVDRLALQLAGAAPHRPLPPPTLTPHHLPPGGAA
jgi:hypothetical protein